MKLGFQKRLQSERGFFAERVYRLGRVKLENMKVIHLALFAAVAVAVADANLALNKPVSGKRLIGGQNTWPNLVDGDPTTCADSGPLVRNPAFKIDLGQEYLVRSVKLVFATGCENTISGKGCGYQNTLIEVGDGQDRKQDQDCTTMDINADKAKGEKFRTCSPGPVVGRYVVLLKTGPNDRAIHLCELKVFGEPVENIALNKLVSGKRLIGGQNTWPNLVDGDPTTCADSGPLVHNPAFKIDLGQEYIVHSVKLRFASGCKNTISGLGCGYVNSLIEVGEGRDWRIDEDCTTMNIKADNAIGEKTRVCSPGPITGRYVVLLKTGPNDRAIHLCELKVYGTPVAVPTLAPPTPAPPTPAPPTPAPPTPAPSTAAPPPVKTAAPVPLTTYIPTLPPCEFPPGLHNVAQGKTATQSSDKSRKDSEASNAVDGDYTSDANSGACSWTNKEFQPWWKVDLGESFDIYEVVITNRQDCCPFRIKNAEIRVGDSANFDDNPVCGRMILGRMTKEQPIHVRCGCETAMSGRYVSIQLIDREQQLHMCEVEVMAA